MSSLPPNASTDEIEEELVFLEVLIDSLDAGADDYAEKLATFHAQKEDLEGRLAGSQGGSRPQTSHEQNQLPNHMPDMDGSNDQSNGWWQTTLNGRPGSNGGESHTSLGGGSYSNSFGVGNDMNVNLGNGYGGQTSTLIGGAPYSNTYGSGFDTALSNGGQPYTPMGGGLYGSTFGMGTDMNYLAQPNPMKRSLPNSLQHAESQHPSKRPTPEPSNVATPASSSTESFELLEKPTLSDRSLQRQKAVEDDLRKRRDAQIADEQFARSLNQPPPAFASSSSRPGIQTTLNPNGSFQRPRQPETQIKREPGFPMQQQLPRRTRPEVVDLTNSDDEEVSEVSRNSFTPSKRTENRSTRPMLPPPQMPGAFPNASGYQSVYGSSSTTQQQRYPGTPHTNPLVNGAMSAVSGIRNVASSLGSTLDELSSLINGRSRPWDDVMYGGSRPVNPTPTADPFAGYANTDLYQQRRAALEHYDPLKSAEEITSLLENIRPDEDMPAHLRVQTPEAMAVKLHKYQEMGLTWLQQTEEGKNKGGMLADDMGLGKTIQMLSLIVTRKSEDYRCRTTLIVAPVALMRQWRQEIEQKIKTGRHRLSVFVHHGQTKKKHFSDLSFYDIVLTTYGSLAAELKRLEMFTFRQKQYGHGIQPSTSERCVLIAPESKWYRVILDESQCIKNVKTQTAKAACHLQAEYRFCVTGTPMHNNIEELYSQIKFLKIKPYNEWDKFRLDFVTPLKASYDRERAMRMLQILIKAIMLRRTKSSTYEGQPILVLPDRSNHVVNPEFSEDEEIFYRALENRTQLQFNKYLRAGTVGSSYTAILVLLLRLRQACCHPHLIKDFGVSAAADVSPDDLLELARALDPQVVERIKASGGNFECPVCYDAVTNPAIFLPCGHDTCSDCFARIADPANAIRDGNENATNAKCPNCRAAVDPKRITDFDSFKKVHMPELLSEEEQRELQDLFQEFAEGGQDDDESDSDSDTESDDSEDDDDVDNKGNLKGFIVNDDEGDDSETESEAGDAVDDEEEATKVGVAGPSKKTPKGKGKATSAKKSNPGKKGKGKGKKEKQPKKKKKKSAMTLAELKRLSTRNKSARKRYMARIRKDWMSSAKIDKTMDILKDIMNNPEGEKVLIFSQWTSLLDLLEVPVDEQKWKYRRYDGSMNPKMRGDAVDDFRDPKQEVRIMLVSLKAGNAGLNLNAANNIIILDPFWNPYIEEQAVDRAHRLGQTRPVKVHRVLVPNTVEDRIIELQEKKRALISEALDEKAGQNIARLGVRELAYLFGVSRNPTDQVAYVPRSQR